MVSEKCMRYYEDIVINAYKYQQTVLEYTKITLTDEEETKLEVKVKKARQELDESANNLINCECARK